MSTAGADQVRCRSACSQPAAVADLAEADRLHDLGYLLALAEDDLDLTEARR